MKKMFLSFFVLLLSFNASLNASNINDVNDIAKSLSSIIENRNKLRIDAETDDFNKQLAESDRLFKEYTNKRIKQINNRRNQQKADLNKIYNANKSALVGSLLSSPNKNLGDIYNNQLAINKLNAIRDSALNDIDYNADNLINEITNANKSPLYNQNTIDKIAKGMLRTEGPIDYTTIPLPILKKIIYQSKLSGADTTELENLTRTRIQNENVITSALDPSVYINKVPVK